MINEKLALLFAIFALQACLNGSFQLHSIKNNLKLRFQLNRMSTDSLDSDEAISDRLQILKSIISSKSDVPNQSEPNWLKVTLASLGIMGLTFFSGPTTSLAADTAKVGLCLLKSCQQELLQCVLYPKCFANIICSRTW